MRGLIAAIAGLVGGLSGGWAISLAIPAPPPLVSFLKPPVPVAVSMPCRTMADIEAQTLPGQVHLVDLRFIYGKQFEPVTGILLVHHNVDDEVVMGYVFDGNCVGDPIVVTREPLNHITGR